MKKNNRVFYFFLLILLACSFHAACAKQHHVSFEGTVKRGDSYRHPMGNGLTFILDEDGYWTITVTPSSHPGDDLVYPVNPPYRTPQHLVIGDEYQTAKESVANSPRIFRFLCQADDLALARAALEKVLGPKTVEEQNEGLKTLDGLPQGEGTLEVLSASYEKDPKAQGGEAIHELRFKVDLRWPVKAHSLLK